MRRIEILFLLLIVLLATACRANDCGCPMF